MIIKKELIIALLALLMLGFSSCVPVDSKKPTITLLGEVEVYLSVGDNYIDAGAKAHDDVDGDITDKIKTVSTVDTSIAGDYIVSFNVSDAAGNKADEARRKVVVSKVEDKEKPIITLLGKAIVNQKVGESYSDAGATAQDNIDGDITDKIKVVSTVDTSKVGEYTVTYNVSDKAGNKADEVIRKVKVKEEPDNEKPLITLLGKETVKLEVGESYNDAGATAHDNVDGDISDKIKTVSTVDTSKVGDYTVKYNVSDTAGNEADEVVRKVKVANASQVEYVLEIHANTDSRKLGAFNIYLDFPKDTVTIDKDKGDTGLEKGANTEAYTIMVNPNDTANGHYRLAGMTASDYTNGDDVHLASIHATSASIPNASDFAVRVNEIVDEYGHEITAAVVKIIVVQ